jgi:hypothetical protein
MGFALTISSSTNHHLFSSLDGQPQNGWLFVLRGKFLIKMLKSRPTVESLLFKKYTPSSPLFGKGRII